VLIDFVEIEAGQLQAARVEPSEASQLIDPDLRRHVAEIALGAREHHVDLTLGVALDAVKSILFEEFRRVRAAVAMAPPSMLVMFLFG